MHSTSIQAIMAAAVVARPDDKWGETPLRLCRTAPRHDLSEEDVIEHCRGLLARFKCPRSVIFREVPKTSTGKIQKFLLREEARSLGNLHESLPPARSPGSAHHEQTRNWERSW
jgi:fatty-acyl-CoA synthase